MRQNYSINPPLYKASNDTLITMKFLSQLLFYLNSIQKKNIYLQQIYFLCLT